MYSQAVNKRSRFKTLRQFVAAQPRSKTQGEIARELGITESALSMYLSGARIPSKDVALRIRDYTGIPLDNLIDPQLIGKAS